MKTKSGKAIGLAVLVLLLLGLGISAQAGEWKVNHVVVAGSGKIEVIALDGTVIDSGISTNTGGRLGGCVFASSYVLRCVDYDNMKIVKFALQDPHAPTQTISLSPSSPNPQSILYMDGPINNLLLGFAGGTVNKYDYTGALLQSCGPVATDALSTFWMQIGSDNKTVFYTSGIANNGTGTLRKFSLSACPSPTVSSLFSLRLPLYGVLALPNGLGVVDGSGGFILAVGTDILQVDSAGKTVKTYAKLADERSNDWRAVWPTADGSAFVAVNLATGNLFEFSIGSKTVEAKKLAGPFPTINAGTPDEVGGITVFAAFDAAEAQPQIATLSLTPTSDTGRASFFDIPACCTGPPPVPPNKVTITLNGIPSGVTDTATIRFTEIAPVVGKSDTGLDCALADQEGKECIIYEIEVSTTASSGTGFDTADWNFFSPQTIANSVLLDNGSVDVTTLLALDETDVGGGGGLSVFSLYLLPSGVLTSSGWQPPIGTTVQNAINIGQSLKIQFSTGASSASFNCLSTGQNCPFVTITMLRDGKAPAGFCPPGGVSVEGGTGTGTLACGLIFRPVSADGWGANWDTGTATDGCYILTGNDPQHRFNIFSYAESTAPFTTIIRLGTATVQECTNLAGQLGIVIH